MPQVSIVITSYNQSKLLRVAIDSALAQSHPASEILVCDDASTDDSPELIRSYATRHPDTLKPVLQVRNLGVAANRNSGIRAASGDFITWLDGDDYYDPKKLDFELRSLDQSGRASWVYSQVNVINHRGEAIGQRFQVRPEGDIFKDLPNLLGRAPRSMLVARHALHQAGYFNEELDLYEDFEFCLRLAKNYTCAYCDQALSYYRLHGSGLHGASSLEHERNLGVVRSRLKELVSDLDSREQTDLLRQFSDRMDLLMIGKASVEGHFSEVLKYGGRLIRRTPTRALDRGLYHAIVRSLSVRNSTQSH